MNPMTDTVTPAPLQTYQAAPVQAVQVTRPFSAVMAALPGATPLKDGGKIVGLVVPATDAPLAQKLIALEGAWVVFMPGWGRVVLTAKQFTTVHGYQQVVS